MTWLAPVQPVLPEVLDVQMRIRGVLQVSAVLIVMTVAAGNPVHAHGALKSSTPAQGDTLQVPPAALRLTFTERVELGVSRLVLVRNETDTVALSALRMESNGFVLVADVVGSASPGSYVIHWTVAGADGHPVRGTIPFLLAGDAAGPPPGSGLPAGGVTLEDEQHRHAGEGAGGAFASNALLATVLRVLLFSGLLVFVGAVLVHWRIVPMLGAPGADLAAPLATWGASAAALLVAVDVARLYVQRAALGGNGDAMPLITVLDTTWGRGWMLHVAGAVTGALLFWIARRGAMPAQRILLLAALLQVAVGTSLGGHAAAAANAFLAVTNDVVHIVAAGGWVGALALVLLVLWPRLSGNEVLRLEAMRQFSTMAVGAVVLLLLSGVGSTWIHHGFGVALWETRYGSVLLLKVAAVLVMIVLGARNHRALRVSRGAVAPAVHTRAWIELSLTVLVIVATAVLVATPTPPAALHGG